MTGTGEIKTVVGAVAPSTLEIAHTLTADERDTLWWQEDAPTGSDEALQMPPAAAAGALVGILLLGALAGAVSLPRPEGPQSLALVRPAPVFEEADAAPAVELPMDPAGVPALASAR
jgi:hypothetical protein